MSDDENAATAARAAAAGAFAGAVSGAVGAGRVRRHRIHRHFHHLHRPLRWFLLSLLSCVVTFFVWIWGVFSSGLDVGEMCAQRGQTYDGAYRGEHLHELNRVFPLHDMCNSSYDLVPAWVNPALVLFSLVTVGSLLAVCWTTFVRVRRFWRTRRTRRATR